MNNKNILLLKNLFLSTSDWNAVKHAEGKEKKKFFGRIFGYFFLAIYFGFLAGFLSFAMAIAGFPEAVPVILASALSLVSLVFTLLKAGGYLYGFKEYDMIMSMPFSVPTVVSSRFLLMYLRDLRTDILISAATLIGYGIAVHPAPWVYVVWMIMTPFIPLIPTVIGALIGAFVARIGSNMKHKSLVQTVLIYIFIIPLFFTNYIVNYLIQSGRVGAMMDQSSGVASGIATYLPTVGWFAKAVTEGSVVSFLLFLVVSMLVYVVAVALISRNFRRINSALESHGIRRKAKIGTKEYRKKTVVQAIMFKEYKRFTGSTVCATNILMGTVLAVLFGVIFLIFKGDDILLVFTHGYPVDIRPYISALPLAIYFFVGMMPSTVASPSLEGKNEWIIKTLPIKASTIYSAKMLFNIVLVLPAALFATLAGCYSFHAHWIDVLLCVYLITLFCTFSTVYGMRCGLKHAQLEWENETEVVKRGPAVNFYMLPNMFGTMLLFFGIMFLASRFPMRLLMLAISALYLVLTVLSYASVQKMAAKA